MCMNRKIFLGKAEFTFEDAETAVYEHFHVCTDDHGEVQRTDRQPQGLQD